MIISRHDMNGYKLVARTFLGYRMDPCDNGYGIGTDVDTFAVYECTYEHEKTGKRTTRQELELA